MLSFNAFRARISRREIIGTLIITLAYLAMALSFPKSTLVYKHHSRNLGQPEVFKKQKIVFMIVDGMGAQFTFKKEPKIGGIAQTMAPWENKLTIFEDKAKEEPENAILKKSIISPPTWTVDRINSILTGGYPSQALADSILGASKTDSLIEGIPNGPNIFYGDVIWKPLIDYNPKVNFKEAKYFNFFSSGEGIDQSDSSVINTTIKVKFKVI